MLFKQQFERLYLALADDNQPVAQKQAGIDLVLLLGRAMFLEWPGWQHQGFTDTLKLEPFQLHGRAVLAVAAQLRVDIRAIPVLRTFDSFSFGVYVLQPHNPQTDPITVVYELKRRGVREAGILDLNWLDLNTLRNVIQSFLVNARCPKPYRMEHSDMMEGAYRAGWGPLTDDPPLPSYLL